MSKPKKGIWAPGKALARTIKRLAKLGWLKDGNEYVSPHTKINYHFEQACRIEDIPIPSEKPGDAFWKWARE